MKTDIHQADVLALLAHFKPHDAVNHPKVRIGNAGDGGYVLPDDVAHLSAVVSIGISTEVSFDHHFANLGVPVYQYDHTVDVPPFAHPQFHFHKTGWAAQDGEPFLSLSSMFVNNQLAGQDVLLKFDVEGAEWDVLTTVDAALLSQCRIITAEFHDLTQMHEPARYAQFEAALAKLTQHHTCMHVHANNWAGVSVVNGVVVHDVLEATFLRHDRDHFTPYTGPLPTPLDAPNHPHRHDWVLRTF